MIYCPRKIISIILLKIERNLRSTQHGNHISRCIAGRYVGMRVDSDWKITVWFARCCVSPTDTILLLLLYLKVHYSFVRTGGAKNLAGACDALWTVSLLILDRTARFLFRQARARRHLSGTVACFLCVSVCICASCSHELIFALRCTENDARFFFFNSANQ